MEEFKWIKYSKSKEDVLKSLEGEDLNHIFYKAIRNNCVWLLEHCIDNGLDVNDYKVIKYLRENVNSDYFGIFRNHESVSDCFVLNKEFERCLLRYFVVIYKEDDY